MYSDRLRCRYRLACRGRAASWRSTSTPNLRFIFSQAISTCDSPMPEMIVSPVSGSRRASRRASAEGRGAALAAEHRVRRARARARRTPRLVMRRTRRRKAGLLEDRLRELRPACNRRPQRRGRRRTEARAPLRSPRRGGRRTSALPRWSSTTATSSRSVPSRSIVRTKFCDVQPKSQELRTIHACSPAAASPCSFVRPYAESGRRRVGLDVRRALRAVEDVVARPHDERRAELRRVQDAADVHRGCGLRIVLGAVDVRPRRRVQHESAVRPAGGGCVTSQSARVRRAHPGTPRAARARVGRPRR